ncbi:hypothetical protein ACIBTV_17530 [Micromonospora sp. NPDC049366]|uniref:hypothetical protein n=1 Tax=Micromonospora sp. NPDC049366 TaxID=3364271 RepID=UPI0037B6A51C
MARRGWGGSIATAIGVAAGTGAAQLGFGYGLGIINWAPTEADAAPAAWVASLVWATWIAATSTVLGAVCAHRLHERATASADARTGPATTGADAAPTGPATASAGPAGTVTAVVGGVPAGSGAASADSAGVPAGSVERIAEQPAGGGALARFGLALAAGLGALVTALLIAVPARVAEAPDTATPQRVAAAYAMIGVVIGVLSAFWALRSRAAASNIIATVAWLWLLAVIAVVDGVLSGRGLTTAQLGIWQISADRPEFWIRDYLYWPGAVLSLGSALVISVLTARRGARSARHRVGATVSGGAGPLLVALAYLLAVPRLSAISPEQVSAHLIAPYAVIGGIGGSVLIAALAQRADRRSTAATATRTPVVEAAPPPAPTERAAPTEPGTPTELGASGGVEPVASGRARRATSGRARRPVTTPEDAATAADGSGSPSGETVGVTGPRVPAPRVGEQEQREPAGADQDVTPTKGEGRRTRSPRRSD